jgi:hypothetical protein
MADKSQLKIKKKRTPYLTGKEFRARQKKAKDAVHRGMKEFGEWQEKSEKAYRDLSYPKKVTTDEQRHDYDMKHKSYKRGAFESHLRVYKNKMKPPQRRGTWHTT